MTIRAIFLDFYGTVVHEETESLIHICHRIKEESTTNASVGEIGLYWMKEFNQLLHSSHGENFKYQRVISTSSLRNTLAHFHSHADENELSELMFNHWKNPSIFADAVQFFEKNTLPVFILSNVDHLDITEAINLLHLKVDGVVTSQHVKAYKPHKDMFSYALEINGLKPEDVLHVGDSLSSDVFGARQVGIQTAWLNRNHKPFSGEAKPDYEIRLLTDILEIPALINN